MHWSRAKFDWRAEFLKLCGPGLLAGVRAGDWFRLLRQRGFAIHMSRGPRALSVSMQSLKNSFWARVESKRFDVAVREVDLQPPVFILGHWRSGTTHLHEILCRDERFGYPNSYQTSFPLTFLSTEQSTARWLSWFIPGRRPMDEMALSLSSPQEDEFALCASTLMSPCLGWVFPRQRRDFDKYLTLESLSGAELAAWRDALVWFLKKVQLRCGRPLLLKSPPHTARIRVLLDLFPQARFVHIHRHPYHVIQSSLRTFRILNRWHGLQGLEQHDLEDWILRQYVRMHEAFFKQKELIPGGHFYEIAFEALEKDPLGEVRKLYASLGFPPFAQCAPSLERYLQSVAHYRKNRFPDLPDGLKQRIRRECSQSFQQWGYSA